MSENIKNGGLIIPISGMKKNQRCKNVILFLETEPSKYLYHLENWDYLLFLRRMQTTIMEEKDGALEHSHSRWMLQADKCYLAIDK